MTTEMQYFVTCPQHIEDLLAAELQVLGARDLQLTVTGASVTGDLELGYRLCLWSRIANRVLLRLAQFPSRDRDELYKNALAVDWSGHLTPERTFAVDCVVGESQLTHSHFAALVVKDAIADYFRERSGVRPSVQTQQPDVRVHLHIADDESTLYLDLAGDSLHRRGYRQSGGPASLKENIAAAMLLRARWPEIASRQGSLIDPMCGAGTLVIEAAMMASDFAPGLLRRYFGFVGWLGHDAKLWERLQGEARQRAAAARDRLPLIVGYDIDLEMVKSSLANCELAGFDDVIRIARRALSKTEAPPSSAPGLLISNPPYGKRLGDPAQMQQLYRELGETLKQKFKGWNAAILTSEETLARATGLSADRIHALNNGPIPCRLYHFSIFLEELRPTNRSDAPSKTSEPPSAVAGNGAGSDMFANRVRKNLQKLKRWAQREAISCFRVYDADLPEYAVAIDWYEHQWVVVQEYAPSTNIEPAKQERRLQTILQSLPELLQVREEDIFYKFRRRQKRYSQYEPDRAKGRFHRVWEGDCTFAVNFTDYLDTGLFLDHRLIRRHVRHLAAGRSFLNLFAYTGTATVHANRGRALRTVSVDSSNNYLDWAQENLNLNNCEASRNQLVCEECRQWLAHDKQLFDLILIDPPTFSNSKKFPDFFDLQRDHVSLIRAAVEHLEPQGILLFSAHSRSFRMETESLGELLVRDISSLTLPLDFQRKPLNHKCWQISREAAGVKFRAE